MSQKKLKSATKPKVTSCQGQGRHQAQYYDDQVQYIMQCSF